MDGKPRLSARLLLSLGGAVAALYAQQPLGLRQVLEAAGARAEIVETSLAAAQAQVRLLETQNRTRFELRPQLGLFSFSQPALLASTLGSWLTLRRPSSETAFALQVARLDLLSAELAQARSKLRSELEAARRFFQALERQQAAEEACAAVGELMQRRPALEKLLTVARLTAVDKNRFEQELAERELGCQQARTAHRLAVQELAATVGLSLEHAEVLLEEPELAELSLDFEPAATEKLAAMAIASRGELGIVRERINAASRKTGTPSRLLPASFSFRYALVSEAASGTLAPGSYLLGGHTLYSEAAWDIPARGGNESEAWRQALAARVRNLEIQWDELEREVRNEIERLRILALDARERLRIAGRQAELASKGRKLVETRAQHGLAQAGALREAEREESRARAAERRARQEMRAHVLTIAALCGIHDSRTIQQEVTVTGGMVARARESDVGNREELER